MNKITLENIELLDFATQEAYKTLRGNVGFCGADIQTIVITSTEVGEGKTNVALHLAISMAEAGYKVCLIDADLRKSTIVGMYNIAGVTNGLTNYLLGQNEWDECIYATEYDNLHCIFAGPSTTNPSELLGSVVFEKKLEELKGEYDYVIIDTPPLGKVIDGAVAAAVSDGALLVIESNNVSAKEIRRTKNQLERTGCRLLGAVINKVDDKTMSKKDSYFR